jgi:transposase-like protein
MLNEKSGLLEAIEYFSDPMICIDAVAAAKWKDGPECPKCGGKKVSFIRTRMLWTCLGCRKQFSVKVGTIFEDSAVPLNKWLVAMWMLACCKNGVSSYELGRAIKVTQKTAWFMLQRIRHAMHTGSINKMTGEIEADETFIGGKARNMHLGKRTEKIHGRGPHGKAVVLGLLSRHDEKVRTYVIPTRKKPDIQARVRENVEQGAALYTDALKSYEGLAEYAHQVVDHADCQEAG